MRALIRVIKLRIKTFLKKRGMLHKEEDFITGLPSGLSMDDLSKVVPLNLEKRPGIVCYRHLSGWKHSGAFRLLIKKSFYQHDSFVFKNAKYTGGHIVALSEFPVFPGPPEFQVYQTADKDFQAYLPKIYLSREIVDGLHYQYIMEDLGKEYEVCQGEEQILFICKKLFQIHSDLKKSLNNQNKTALLKYDRSFSEKIMPYIFQNLNRLREQHSNSVVDEVIRIWEQLSEVYSATMDKIFRQEIVRPIHGDLNSTNILFHRTAKHKFKLIDWEWVGVGVPHFDLAALLKGVSPEVEQKGLLLYSNVLRQRGIEMDRQIYEWCKLQRGLIDASFFVKQTLDSKVPPKNELGEHINRALQRALKSYVQLLEYHG